MGRYTGPVCRMCRREGQKLFLKGTKCYTEKCPVERRNYVIDQMVITGVVSLIAGAWAFGPVADAQRRAGRLGDVQGPDTRGRPAALDDAVALQPLQPVAHGRLGQADDLRERAHGLPAVRDQRAQHGPVGVVEWSVHGPAHLPLSA